MLNEVLGDGDVRFDIDERTLTTGGRTYHGITFLGSFSHLDQTWLWAWDNEHFRDDLSAIEPLRAVREYGRRHDIAELTIGRLDLSGFPNPHQAATTMVIAAAALLGGNGVHSCRINDEKGSAYFHLDDPQLPVAAYDPLSASRLLMTAVETSRPTTAGSSGASSPTTAPGSRRPGHDPRRLPGRSSAHGRIQRPRTHHGHLVRARPVLVPRPTTVFR